MIWRPFDSLRSLRAGLVAIVVVLLLVAAALPLVRHLREVPAPAPPPIRFSFVAPAEAQLGVGDEVLDAALSPDGSEIVFVATSNGTAQLWHRRLDADRAERLPGTVGAAMPAWKRTGRVVAFFADGKLKQIAIADRGVRDLADASRPAGIAWLADGSLLFVPDARGPVRHLQSPGPVAGSSGPSKLGPYATDVTRLKAGERGHGFPSAAGDESFVYTATLDSGVRVVRLVSNGMERDLTATSADAQLVGDQLLYLRDATLVAQRVNVEMLSLIGRARPLAFDVGASAIGRGFFAGSPRVLVWASAGRTAHDLTWFDLQGRNGGTVGEPADYWQVRLSPDDREAALTMLDPLLRTLDVFLTALTGSASAAPQRLTRALAADSDPVWSPRGDRILFKSLQGGRPDLFSRPAHAATSRDEPVLQSDLDETPSDWQNGRILFHAPANGPLDIWSLDIASGMQTPVTRSGFNEFDAHVSPDGRLIAYVSDESGQPEIYVQAPAGRTRVTSAGGMRPQWSRDGRSLLFLRDGRLMRADLMGRPEGRPLQFETPRLVLGMARLRDYSLAHHSDRVLVITPIPRSDPAIAGVIVNWMTGSGQ
jgi:serine/threonine-protein kinase